MSKATPEKSTPVDDKPTEQAQEPVAPVLEPTSMADIKAKMRASREGELVTLPSGLVFRLTRPSISKLLKANVFPNSLIAKAIEMDAKDAVPQNRDEYLKSLEVINTIVKHAAVHPQIVLTREEESDDNIVIDDLTDQDKISIYLYAQAGVTPLDSFRS